MSTHSTGEFTSRMDRLDVTATQAPTTPLYRYDKFGPAEAIDTENGVVAAFTGDERNLVVGPVDRNEQSPPDTNTGTDVTDGGPSLDGA